MYYRKISLKKRKINLDGHSSFKNLIPILKDKNILPLLFSLENQASLEKFLKEKKINLSLEEIEKLWDVIEVCKPYYSKNNLQNRNLESQEHTRKVLPDEELNVSGGFAVFYNKVRRMLGLSEDE